MSFYLSVERLPESVRALAERALLVLRGNTMNNWVIGGRKVGPDELATICAVRLVWLSERHKFLSLTLEESGDKRAEALYREKLERYVGDLVLAKPLRDRPLLSLAILTNMALGSPPLPQFIGAVSVHETDKNPEESAILWAHMNLSRDLVLAIIQHHPE